MQADQVDSFLMLKWIMTIALLLCTQAFAVQEIICIPQKNKNLRIQFHFPRDVDPAHPFRGFLYFNTTLKINDLNENRIYQNPYIRITPEVYTTDINLRGDAEDVYIRLYPQFENEKFSHYTGQLFINDLNTRSYFNFRNENNQPGFICR